MRSVTRAFYSNSPVEDYKSPDIACNHGTKQDAKAPGNKPAALHLPVKAGEVSWIVHFSASGRE